MTEPNSTLPVSAADIDAAARVVAPFAVRTPLLSFPVLDERAGTKVFLKPEMLQRDRFRSSSAAPSTSCRRSRKPNRGGGVVAFSSGNHAQGVAAAAKILNMQAIIVMPATHRSPSASAPKPMAPRSCCTTATRMTAKPSPTASPASVAPRWYGPMTIPS